MHQSQFRIYFTAGILAALTSWPSLPLLAQQGSAIQEVRALLPGYKVKASKKAGWLTLGEWRESELHLTRSGFQLILEWNGLDDEHWPFEKIVSKLARRNCGQISVAAVKGQVDRLYKTRSLIKETDLGGNGGTSFKKRLTTRLGRCAATFNAEGARWHHLGVSVSGS